MHRRMIKVFLSTCACFSGLALLSSQAFASDACSARAILTQADVSVSDGSTYQTRTYYNTPKQLAFDYIGDRESRLAIEGPFVWNHAGSEYGFGGRKEKEFALGHQFHAFLQDFDDIVSASRPVNDVLFDGKKHAAVAGDLPYGGTAYLIQSETPQTPAGLRFNLPGEDPINISFSNWKAGLPWHVKIDDGKRVFDYHFTLVETSEKPIRWFHEAIKPPALAPVQVHRLHRDLLAAHCLSDADMIGRLTAPETVNANRGRVSTATSSETRDRFSGYLPAIDYTAYTDLNDPVIEIAESGELGWAIVNVQAKGFVRESQKPFSDQWAWVMLVKKSDGEWRNAGNASNRASE